MKSECFSFLPILPVEELSTDQDDEIGIVPPLAYFANGGNYPMIRMMKSADANGIVPPLAYFASGGNYPTCGIGPHLLAIYAGRGWYY